MIRRDVLDICVMTPPGLPDPSLAIAASRAEALGTLNLEFAGTDHDAALAAFHRLVAFGRNRLAVALDGEAESLLDAILAEGAPSLETIFLTATNLDRLPALVELIHRADKKVFLVVTSPDEARAGERAGVDAIAARGHEAGGWIGDETSFVLAQHLLARSPLPIWVQGGIGLHSAAACAAAGVAGVVLDSQVLLTRESPLPEAARARLATMDGSEAQALGTTLGAPFRAYLRPTLPIAEELRELERSLAISADPRDRVAAAWRVALRQRVDWSDSERGLLAIGQDAALAASFARRFGTVGGVVTGLRRAVREHLAVAIEQRALDADAPLARSHGLRYPIVQGPMTRVSDRAEFAAAVAEGGALPFVALALMRAPEVKALLEETRDRLGERPWGVGILGFVPADLRADQLEVIRAVRPPYALIAGGRPDQARMLERDGIPTYLHVPSPGLLRMFVQDGARRFVFEGRECGGHVGPRTSFVLWELMIDVLLDEIAPGESAAEYHVLFAGGIHDARSAAMVAALAAPLAARGVRIGVLIGTGYIFTVEAVRAGAIVEGFQQAAVECEKTVLLESGPGHATRGIPSPFVDTFADEKRELLRANLTSDDLRNRLEELNVGRLRIASKGLDRHPRFGIDPDAPKLVEVDPVEQWRQGLYMIGQVATLRDRVCSIAELHEDVSRGSARRLEELDLPEEADADPPPPPAAVAIVGMATILPGATDLSTYWSNILNKVDALRDVPPERWDWRSYFDPDRSARDKVYSHRGGFIDDVPFDPMLFGMPPSTLASIEPFQLLTLATVRAALDDAGLLDRPFPKERTSVILGAGGGAGDLTVGYVTRSNLPALFGKSADAVVERLDASLPEWTEDSFAGLLMNVAAGRVANRFDLGGVNYTVDAACASSLAAVYHAVRDLEARTSDVVLVGGVDAIQNPFGFLCFAKTQALSPSGRCAPFDADADGIAISEGFAVLVMKRLEDAERDGDRIYAVIRGVGGSSDGRDRGLTAPRPEGQIRALRRAYAQAGFSPATVGLIEAHGTGTVAGDQAEIQALTRFFREADAPRQATAIGSVKSMIGHTKATAGVAGLTKIALALHHRVLPPTLGVQRPNPRADFPSSPFYPNVEPRPWLRRPDEPPRRAGASAFGFGGTNFHVVVEEYSGEFAPRLGPVATARPAELFVWQAPGRAELSAAVARLKDALDRGAKPPLADLAYSLALATGPLQADQRVLAIVAESLDDLRAKLAEALKKLDGEPERVHDPRGIHFSDAPLRADGKVAFVFPGQGSQYVNMARDLAVWFPEARAAFEDADAALAGPMPERLSRYVFPPPVFTKDEETAQLAALTETNVAQPALGAASLAYYRVLIGLGLAPELTAGHSYGEFVALHAAGSLAADDLFRVSEARGRFMREASPGDGGTMAAVEAGPDVLKPLLVDLEVTLANLNAPRQTVISGTRPAVEAAVARCAEHKIRARVLPVARAFHSPLVAGAQQRFAAFLEEMRLESPRMPVFSNTTAQPHPADVGEIRRVLGEHLARPVEFTREIQAMYDSGARIFVEVGPKTVLTGLIGRILEERPHLAVAVDQPKRPAYTQVLHVLAATISEGVVLNLRGLYQGRPLRRLDLARLDGETGVPAYGPTTWLVNGGRARPAHHGPEEARMPLEIAVVGHHEPGRSDESVNSESAQSDNLVSPELVNSKPASVGPTARAPETARRSEPGPRSETAISHPDRSAPAETHPDVAARSASRSTQGRVESTMGQVQPAEPLVVYPRIESPRPRPIVPSASPGAAEVVLQFQQVMHRFLETQRSVMLAYLQGTGGAAAESGDGAAVDLGGAVGANSTLEPAPRPLGPVPAPTGNGYHPAPRTSNGHASIATTTAKPAVVRAAPRPVAPPPTRPPSTPTPRLRPIARSEAPRPVAEPPALVQTPARPVEAKPASSSVALGRDELTNRLLAVVSDRTGYPAELLGLDADLEADLGIDSIKRVEIIGTFLKALDLPPERKPEMEQLTGSRTLRKMIDLLVAHAEPERGAVAAAEGDARPFDFSSVGEAIGRFRVAVVPAPPAELNATLSHDGVILLTDDGRGVAARLAARLREAGHPVVQVFPPGAASAEGYGADLTQPGEVARLLDEVHRQHGRVTALIHLSALVPGNFPLDPSAWRERLDRDLRGLFLLAQALRPDLEAAAANGGAALLAVTALGGGHGADGLADDVFPGHGALAGFLKTVAQEWPSVRVKALDVSSPDAARIADQIFAELYSADGGVEIGYRGEERVRLAIAPAPIAPGAPTSLGSDAVILVTGGARGITAEVAARIAETYRPTLILVGRTRLSNVPEGPETAGLDDPATLKRAIADSWRQQGRAITPVQIEEAYRRITHEREVRANLDRIERAGARVRYVVGDARDEESLGSIVAEIYREYGRIDGVIHGAGIVEDKLVRDKALDSFDRVVRTKVDGAVILARALRPESLRFLVFFTSIAGRFGNPGQADYGAANEAVSRLAIWLNQRWPSRVAAISFGPWATLGMATPTIQRQFRERGVALVPVEVGCQAVLDEIASSEPSPGEVVVAGGAAIWPDLTPLPPSRAREGGDRSDDRSNPVTLSNARRMEDDRSPKLPLSVRGKGGPLGAPGLGPARAVEALPLLRTASSVSYRDDGIEVDRILEVPADAFLDDHRLATANNRPVLPLAIAGELLAESAVARWPERRVVAIHDLRMLGRVILNDDRETVRVVIRASQDGVHLAAAELHAPAGSPRLNYRGTIELGEHSAILEDWSVPALESAEPYPLEVSEAYARWMFHGPRWRMVEEISAIAANGLSARGRAIAPGQLAHGAGETDWVLDPVFIDCAAQLGLFWTRARWDTLSLPTRAARLRQFAPCPPTFRAELRVRSESAFPLLVADILLLSDDGQPLALVEGFEFTADARLNALGGTHDRGERNG